MTVSILINSSEIYFTKSQKRLKYLAATQPHSLFIRFLISANSFIDLVFVLLPSCGMSLPFKHPTSSLNWTIFVIIRLIKVIIILLDQEFNSLKFDYILYALVNWAFISLSIISAENGHDLSPFSRFSDSPAISLYHKLPPNNN